MRGQGFQALPSGSMLPPWPFRSPLPALCASHTGFLTFLKHTRHEPTSGPLLKLCPHLECLQVTQGFLFLLKSHLLKEVCPDHHISCCSHAPPSTPDTLFFMALIRV